MNGFLVGEEFDGEYTDECYDSIEEEEINSEDIAAITIDNAVHALEIATGWLLDMVKNGEISEEQLQEVLSKKGAQYPEVVAAIRKTMKKD